jgi:hypothetical protein
MELQLERTVGFQEISSDGIHHWYNGSGDQLCDPQNVMKFTGRRSSLADIRAHRICIPCLTTVTEVFGQGNIP